MRLEECSVDILGYITTLLHGFDIANLWFSGAPLLRYKLAHGGIPQLEWTFEAKFRLFKWPALFSSLARLSRFRFIADYNHPKNLFSSSQIATLPRNLQELGLNCFGAISALNELIFRNPECFPLLRKLEITNGSSDEKVEPAKEVFWPQSLEHIKVLAKAHYQFALDLSKLPPNLTFLRGDFTEIIASETTTRFPQSLISLHLTVTRFLDFFPLLPPCLEELWFDAIYQSSNPDDPQNNCQYETWKADGIRNLPPSLQYICLPIQVYTCDILRQLPPNLTEIEHYDDAIATEEEFALLPPRLTFCHQLLPPLITKDIAMRLPKSITSFMGEVALDAIPYLNPKLSELTIAPLSNDPSTFESLGTDRIAIELKTLVLPNLDRIPFSAIPSSLTSLELLSDVLTTEEIKSLPKSLLILKMGNSDASAMVEDWKYLPENLQELSCCIRSNLPSVSSMHLPRNMTSLILRRCKTITQDWFEGLPQTLKKLRITLHSFANSFQGNVIWPRDLVILALTVENYELNTQTMSRLLKSLPRIMDFLTIIWYPLHQTFSISPEDLAYLPKRLKSVRLPK